MADPTQVPDENSPFEDKIAYLRSQNISEDAIAKHFSQVNDPNAQAWIRQYKTGQAQTAAAQVAGPAPAASSPAPGSLDTSGVQALSKVGNKAANWYANLSTPEQIAYPIGTVLGTYAAGKAINYAYDTLKDKRQADIEVKKQAALNALEPSAAVKVQQQQLALQQAEQANRFAQQAAGANAGPVSDPLLDARVQTETQRAASEAARTKAAEAQAALNQEKLIAVQRKAAMAKANPAGAAAQVAAAEALPVDAQITPTTKPTIAELAQQLTKAPESGNATPIEGGATPPINAEPAPVSPVNATPPAPETPTTTAQVVADPNTTPVNKAVTLVEEAPKVAGAAEPQVLKTGTGKPAFAGEGPATTKFKSSYPDVKSVPQGYAFVPGAQAINTLRNNIGQETFTEHYSKNPYPADYKEALQQGQDINKSLGRMTRDEMKLKGIEPPNVVPGIGAQVGGVKGSRLINVGMNGIKTAGLLVALTDLAKADSLPEAMLRGVDIATDYIPGVSSLKQTLSSSTTNAGEEEKLAYLRRMQAAKELGAGNRGKAFDPRIPYNSALANIGIPPPYSR